MSFNLRIFLSYFSILGLAIYLLLNTLMSELKPGVRQSTEDALVDMSNILAELVLEDFLQGRVGSKSFSSSMERFLNRSYRAKISFVDKSASDIRIYITDDKGLVIYDSDQVAVGQDYSQWNDVYLTLKGEYGARSTLADPDNGMSSVMHVAAPILNDGRIVGVLTVAKPNLSLQPFIDNAQRTVKIQSLWLVILSLFATVGIAFWLTRSIRKLSNYADSVARGERVNAPQLSETELAKLASSMDNMRRQLDGKDYIEKYVHTLTHELKSPVSAIKGAAELIHPDMPDKDQRRFVGNIQLEVERIDEVINRLLALVTVEAKESLENIQRIDLRDMLTKIVASKELILAEKNLPVALNVVHDIKIRGDLFLLTQAVDNLLQNSIDFSVVGKEISITVVCEEDIEILIKDNGEGIPDYALDKIFERFYSLPRPKTHKKSSGLGLCFVKQIVELHGGAICLENLYGGGVLASLKLPKN
jgi:two-component system sensor histidine kinase CreC